jgi:hypothetical protein
VAEDYDNRCYEKPFLKEVIARVDFAAPVTSLGTKIPQKVGNAALEKFPILEERKTLAQELQVSAAEENDKRDRQIILYSHLLFASHQHLYIG